MNVTSSPELEKLKGLTVVAQPEISLTEAIAKNVTARVLESLSAESLSSEIEPLDTEVKADVDLAEQEKAEVVSAESPVRITIPKELQAVTIEPDIVALLRAALRANLTHTVIKVLTILLKEK